MPKTTPVALPPFHWPTMLKAVGRSALVTSIRLSAESWARPAPARTAPPVPDELLQPRPGPPGGFEHGHAITPPTPGLHRLVNPAAPRSRRNASGCPFVSPGTRFVPELTNTMNCPPVERAGSSLAALPCVPEED